MTHRTALAALAALAVLAFTASAAPAAIAPGRVAFSVASATPQTSSGDPYATNEAAALPGGGVVMLDADQSSALAVRLRADGSRDATFGTGGIAHITAAGANFRAEHVVALPDGRLLIAGSRPTGPPSHTTRLVVVRLLADGTADPTFGANGVVDTAFQTQPSNVHMTPMALAPDGSIVLSGALPRSVAPGLPDWVVARLRPDGTPDTGFGVVKIAVGAGPSRGVGVVVTPAGSIVALGVSVLTGPAGGDTVYLAGLTALGMPDPGFGGGVAVLVPLNGASRLERRAGGALDVLGLQGVVRFSADGALDASYASGGVFATLDQSQAMADLVALPDGGSLLVRQLPQLSTGPLESRLGVQGLTSAGANAGTGFLATPFGGGNADPGKRTAGSVAQNSFHGSLVRRDDGTFVAIGHVNVLTPGGKLDGVNAEFVAAAAFTPQLAPDPAFGGPQQPAVVGVRVRPQRAVSSARLKRIKLRLTASEAGLVALRVRDTRGALLAGSLQPVYAAGTKTVLVPLTSLGVRRLRAARHGLRIRVRHQFRDIVAGAATGVTRGRLR